MVDLVNILTQTETLLESNMLGTLIASYMFLFVVLFVSFLNIYSVDKYEFLNNKQKCMKFKYKVFFVIMYSKQKKIVSKKTFILELIGYLISISALTVFICSLKLNVTIACILLGVVSLFIFAFGCVTGDIYRKIKKYK